MGEFEKKERGDLKTGREGGVSVSLFETAWRLIRVHGFLVGGYEWCY